MISLVEGSDNWTVAQCSHLEVFVSNHFFIDLYQIIFLFASVNL